jgi:mannose-6-phosphate isomerase-like protein (cupin superfamily)
MRTEDTMRQKIFAGLALGLALSTHSPLLGTPEGDKRVTFVPGSRVNAAFQKGEPLLETVGYKVHASRRDGPGKAEVHLRDTDIIYVLAGSATVVTGGTVIGGGTVAADEIRGASIEGGTQQQLVRGDVLVVPNGVPHWFTRVDAPFRYYVVKTTTVEGGKP